MADINSTTIQITNSKISRPAYSEDGDSLVVRYPHISIASRRAEIAARIESITCLITANDGEDFDCLADEFQLSIRHMLADMATELHVLCSE